MKRSATSSTTAAVLATAATVLLLSTLASAARTDRISWWSYTHVHVINEFNGSMPLTVHCKSKNDDMGTHTVSASSEYEWRFRPNIFGNTLFWCHVWKGEKEIVYDAYWDDDKSYNRKNMDHVRWVTKDDGLYLRQFWKNVDVFWLPWP